MKRDVWITGIGVVSPIVTSYIGHKNYSFRTRA